MDDPADLRLWLTGNREDRRTAENELRMLREDLTDLLVRGHAAGLKVTMMAMYAGVHRKTAHALLRDARSSRSAE